MSESLYDACKLATDMFCTFSEESPRAIPLGFSGVDDICGGLIPGECGILGAKNGVGKSSLILLSALTTPAKVGIISLEDGPGTTGPRILSHYTGIPYFRIRTKKLTDSEIMELRSAMLQISELGGVRIKHLVGGTINEVEAAVQELAEEGCELIWLDYIHKIKGKVDNRSVDVSRNYTLFQRACSDANVAAMVACQFSRKSEGVPSADWLKETGDLENEARVILLGHSEDEGMTVKLKVDKLTFGPSGSWMTFKRTRGGTLVYSPPSYSRDI